MLQNHRNKSLREYEVQLQQELIALGRNDMADAVAGGRKYQRLDWALSGVALSFEGAVGLRLAFNPDAPVPSSKEEWIEEAMIKYADDEGLRKVVAEWAIENKKREAEAAAAAAAAKAAAAAETAAVSNAGAAPHGEDDGVEVAVAVKTVGEWAESTATGSAARKQASSETTAVEEGGRQHFEGE